MFISISYSESGIDNKASVISSSSLQHWVEAQKSSNITNFNNTSSSSSTIIQQNDTTIVKASGHFANNQIVDNIVTWIQGGFWDLDIQQQDNKTAVTPNMTAKFIANFTMIRPDGSLSHNHVINNFTSTDVIFAGNDIVITGISHINSNKGTEYEDVPITIHLMGKKVLGLMIDVNKTGGHFSGSNEMYGTLISGIGLDNSTSITNSTINGLMTAESNNITSTNSVAHTGH
ncbi:MAG TPA: hypothetical protein VLE21_01880 [Candidatus Nitrosocosmicus sp.]|nr:hypothetical protein [Candidatus Nitrosocosmicus sp.]